MGKQSRIKQERRAARNIQPSDVQKAATDFANIVGTLPTQIVAAMHTEIIKRLGLSGFNEYTLDRCGELELQNLDLKQKLLESTGEDIPPLFTKADDIITQPKQSYTPAEVVQLTRLARFDEYVMYGEFHRHQVKTTFSNGNEVIGVLQFLGAAAAIREKKVFKEVILAYPTSEELSFDEYLLVLTARVKKDGVNWDEDTPWLYKMLTKLAGCIAKLNIAPDKGGDDGEALRAVIADYSRFSDTVRRARQSIEGGATKKAGWRWVADEAIRRGYQTDKTLKAHTMFADILNVLQSQSAGEFDDVQREALEVMLAVKYPNRGAKMRTWVSQRNKGV